MEQRRQNERLFEVVKKFHEKEEFPNVSVQHDALLPKLRPYQEKAVQWMIYRETRPVIENDYLDFVVPEDESATSSNSDQKLSIERLPSGGILADEMGLGKTVEVLACILNNPRVGVEIPEGIPVNLQANSSSSSQEVLEVSNPSLEEQEVDDVAVFDDNLEENVAVKFTKEVKNLQKEQKKTRARRRNGVEGDPQEISNDDEENVSCIPSGGYQDVIVKEEIEDSDLEPDRNIQMGIPLSTVTVNDLPLGITVKSEIENSNVESPSTCRAEKAYSSNIASLATSCESTVKSEIEHDVDGNSLMESHSKSTNNTAKETSSSNVTSCETNPGITAKSEILNDEGERSNIEFHPESTCTVAKGKKSKKRASKRKADHSPGSQNVKPKKKIVSKTKAAAEAWYQSKLAEVNQNPIRAFLKSHHHLCIPDVQCFCGESHTTDVVKCVGCSRLQHIDCIGASKWIGSKPIYCTQCWPKQDPIMSRATLIVSPRSIGSQWLSEVKNHISKNANFKVLEYKGLKSNGFSQPYDFADYDLILTTYEVLSRELNFADAVERRSSRYEKRYFTPTSPLLCVDFWRICLDEAQMVEGANKAAEMVSRFSCVHRWAVTGTPIGKSLQDLYGLVLFMCVLPYCRYPIWKKQLLDPFGSDNVLPLYTLLAHIMWRSSKSDVLDQIQIPSQTELLWWLNFSPVEEHFYHRTHQECSNDFLHRLSKFEDLDQPLQSLKVSTVNHLLAPLLMLRQACSHPQAVKGNILGSHKNTLTMSALLESLIRKTTVEAQEGLRQHISALNAIAALHICTHEYVSAAAKYREVLQIVEEYKDRCKADSLQILHTYYNLAEVIEQHKTIIPPTLRDDSLRNDALKLEEGYLSKANSAVESALNSTVEYSLAVNNLEKQISLDYDPDWWVNICDSLAEIDEDEVHRRVHDALLNHRKSIPDIASNSIINRVSTFPGIKATLLYWFEEVDKNQGKVKKALKALQSADKETLMSEAVDCHLRASSLKSRKKSLCHLCECEHMLKKYEMNLCDIKDKKNENVLVGEVYLLGQTKEGSWKPSEQETVLRTLLSIARSKKVCPKWLKTGSTFFKLMDALRKELKHLRLIWSRINERICAKDEVNMCKLRLRLRDPNEPSPSSQQTAKVDRRKKQTNQLSSNIDFVTERRHIIEPHQIQQMVHSNQLDAISALSELRKKTGTLAYLQNLRNKGDDLKSNTELCPICRSALENKWAVLSCGHCYCMECTPNLIGRNQIQCAMCRETTPKNDISFVNLIQEDSIDESSLPPVRGSHSTKIEAVLKRLMYLRTMDPLVKVLIFSSWDIVLDVLERALEENGILHVHLKSGATYEYSLKRFKDMNEEFPTTALLLPLKLGSKGLNLTEATHVMLVEPILNPADELQAIGRVHRIGQTKPTFVHRFLIKDTIEDRMFSAVQATGAEHWSKKQVTLKQLKDLFATKS